MNSILYYDNDNDVWRYINSDAIKKVFDEGYNFATWKEMYDYYKCIDEDFDFTQVDLANFTIFSEEINNLEVTLPDIDKEVLDILLNTSESIDYCYVSELDKFYKDFINVLRDMGYCYTEERNLNKMENMQYNTLLSLQTGIGKKCYYIRVKKNSKNKINFYDLSKIITSTPEKVMKSYAKDTDSIAYAYSNAIYLLDKKITKLSKTKTMLKKPFTITGYAKRCVHYLTYRKRIQPIADNVIPDELLIKNADGENMINSIDYFANSYHGGINWKKHRDKVCKYLNVIIYDYNSLYPFAMKKPLPCGQLHYYKGQPKQQEFDATRKGYLCMFLRIRVELELKPDGIPFLQANSIKFKDTPIEIWENTRKLNNETKHIDKTNGKIEITLCYPDYFMMIQNYYVKNIEFVDYCISCAREDLFDKYIDRFYEDKSRQQGGARETSKRLLVTVYGTMCKSRVNYNIDEDEEIVTTYSNISYIHIGSYISSWARFIWLSGTAKLDTLHYGDTDSYHTTKKYDFLKVSNQLGDLKIESSADVGYYYKKKCYMHLNFSKDNNKVNVKITKAGTCRRSIHQIEHLIECLYRRNRKELQGYYELMSQYEGYDIVAFQKYIDSIADIVENNEYERLADVNIPVLYKKRNRPFHYTWIIKWEKFTYSILDEYM